MLSQHCQASHGARTGQTRFARAPYSVMLRRTYPTHNAALTIRAEIMVARMSSRIFPPVVKTWPMSAILRSNLARRSAPRLT